MKATLIRITAECCQPVGFSLMRCLSLDCMVSDPLMLLLLMASRTAGLTDRFLVWRPEQVDEFDPRQSTSAGLETG